MTFWEWLENKSDEEWKEKYNKALEETNRFLKEIGDVENYNSSNYLSNLTDALICYLMEEYGVAEMPKELINETFMEKNNEKDIL